MPTLESVVHSDPEILGGTPVFAGTRVPIKNLLDYLAAGDSLERFLDHFPTVTREQAVAALEIAKDLLTSRRVLLDESLPRPLAELLTGHEARTVAQVRWRGLRNGVLLQQAAAAFDVVLTADQNVAFQQNLRTHARCCGSACG